MLTRCAGASWRDCGKTVCLTVWVGGAAVPRPDKKVVRYDRTRLKAHSREVAAPIGRCHNSNSNCSSAVRDVFFSVAKRGRRFRKGVLWDCAMDGLKNEK